MKSYVTRAYTPRGKPKLFSVWWGLVMMPGMFFLAGMGLKSSNWLTFGVQLAGGLIILLDVVLELKTLRYEETFCFEEIG